MSDPATGRPGLGARVNFNSVLAAGCVLLGLVLLLLIPSQVERPPVLFGESSSALDPAIFPSLVAIGFLLVGGYYLYASFRLNEPNGFSELTGENYLRLAITLAVFLVYAALLQPLGFLLSSAIMVGGLSFFYGARNPVGILLAAVAVPAAVYLVFTRALSVALPELPDF